MSPLLFFGVAPPGLLHDSYSAYSHERNNKSRTKEILEAPSHAQREPVMMKELQVFSVSRLSWETNSGTRGATSLHYPLEPTLIRERFYRIGQ